MMTPLFKSSHVLWVPPGLGSGMSSLTLLLSLVCHVPLSDCEVPQDRERDLLNE